MTTIFWKIFAGVAVLHLAAFVWIVIDRAPPKAPSIQRKQLLVKTISLQPPKILAVAPEPPHPAAVFEPPGPTTQPTAPAFQNKPLVPKPKSVPTPKPAPPKPAPPKPTPPKPTPPVPKVEPIKPVLPPPPPIISPQKQEMLAKARASLSQVTKAAPMPTTVNSSAPLLAMDLPASSGETTTATYQSLVIQQLQGTLKLPEHGEVAISVTIDKNGKVIQFSILTALSTKNRNYVEAEIPKMNFPRFGTWLPGKEKETFEFTLTGTN